MPARQPFRRVANTIAILLIAVVVGGLLVFSLMHRSQTRYVLDTGSMRPTIPAGRAVYDGAPTNLKVGQVVTFRADGEIVTHRLEAIAPNGVITTKGDANLTVDHFKQGAVTTHDVIGVVRYVPPAWLSWTLSRMWLVFVLTAAAAMVISIIGSAIVSSPSQAKPQDLAAVS